MDDRMERMQREYAEKVGVGEDVCMDTLDALGERVDAGSEADDAEIRKAFGTFRAARAALRKDVLEVTRLPTLVLTLVFTPLPTPLLTPAGSGPGRRWVEGDGVGSKVEPLRAGWQAADRWQDVT